MQINCSYVTFEKNEKQTKKDTVETAKRNHTKQFSLSFISLINKEGKKSD